MLDTGLSLTPGNSDSLTYSLASKTVRATERDKIAVYSDAVQSKSKMNASAARQRVRFAGASAEICT